MLRACLHADLVIKCRCQTSKIKFNLIGAPAREKERERSFLNLFQRRDKSERILSS